MTENNDDIIRLLVKEIGRADENQSRRANFQYVETALLLKKTLDKVLSRFNLNSPRIRVLFVLINNGGTMKSKDIAELLRLTRQDISQIIYSLLKYGFISKRVVKDRRSFEISITRKGMDVMRESLNILEKYNDQLMGELNQNDIDSILDITSKMRSSVKKISM